MLDTSTGLVDGPMLTRHLGDSGGDVYTSTSASYIRKMQGSAILNSLDTKITCAYRGYNATDYAEGRV